MKKSGNMPKLWKWCSKNRHGWYLPKQFNKNVPGCWQCHEKAERVKNGQCLATLHHGPGHQSVTHCTEIGPHKIHRCIFGSYRQEASWRGPWWKRKFTEYFDEAPCIEE